MNDVLYLGDGHLGRLIFDTFHQRPAHHGPEYLDQRNYPDKPTPTSLSTPNSAATTTDQMKMFYIKYESLNWENMENYVAEILHKFNTKLQFTWFIIKLW